MSSNAIDILYDLKKHFGLCSENLFSVIDAEHKWSFYPPDSLGIEILLKLTDINRDVSSYKIAIVASFLAKIDEEPIYKIIGINIDKKLGETDKSIRLATSSDWFDMLQKEFKPDLVDKLYEHYDEKYGERLKLLLSSDTTSYVCKKCKSNYSLKKKDIVYFCQKCGNKLFLLDEKNNPQDPLVRSRKTLA